MILLRKNEFYSLYNISVKVNILPNCVFVNITLPSASLLSSSLNERPAWIINDSADVKIVQDLIIDFENLILSVNFLIVLNELLMFAEKLLSVLFKLIFSILHLIHLISWALLLRWYLEHVSTFTLRCYHNIKSNINLLLNVSHLLSACANSGLI